MSKEINDKINLSKALHPCFLGPAASVSCRVCSSRSAFCSLSPTGSRTPSVNVRLDGLHGDHRGLLFAFIIGNGFLFWVMMLRMESERFCTRWLTFLGEVCEVPVELERQPT